MNQSITEAGHVTYDHSISYDGVWFPTSLDSKTKKMQSTIVTDGIC